eukprot:CAMPEP_0172700212 /NCGR_PEP_ID=MMETSP1074-20121228/30738_1 /TAXON_ID=2916 /ORGANISM="Ceratium fusus, Strain PA161109" /LENGTH=247 /DNA_ID=CAMNT_0013521545 /DNA_START=107 /DNA_END=847 /DNA_ORIENTATION=-
MMRTACDATSESWVPPPLVPKGLLPGRVMATASFVASDASHHRPGRTSLGLPCTCTDPTVGNKRGDTSQTSDSVTAALDMQQRDAERQNANALVSAALRDFQKARASYDQVYTEANDAFNTYFDHRNRYEGAFYRYKDAHTQYCRPVVEANDGVKIPCETDWLLAVERFFARRRAPDCLVGQTSGLVNQVREATPFPLLASLLLLLPAVKSFEGAASSQPAQAERLERRETVTVPRVSRMAAELQLF